MVLDLTLEDLETRQCKEKEKSESVMFRKTISFHFHLREKNVIDPEDL